MMYYCQSICKFFVISSSCDLVILQIGRVLIFYTSCHCVCRTLISQVVLCLVRFMHWQSQVKVGNFCFSPPVRRVGCGGLLVSNDCVRRWYWCVFLCTTAAFESMFSWRDLKTLGKFPGGFDFHRHHDECVSLTRLIYYITQKKRGGNNTSKIILDFYPVICLFRWIMVRIGKVASEVVKKLDYQW